jgi:probable F420-dependent oxidoreductase
MKDPIRFSLMLPHFVDEAANNPYDVTFRLARLADRYGYHMGTFGHHSFAPEIGDPSAPFVVLGAIAAQTERLRLGTGVYLAALHHPVTLMEQAATLDQLSGGRAVLGIGLGWRAAEYEGFGIDYRSRASRLEESLALMRTAWTQGHYDHIGSHFTVREAPVHPACVQKPHLPILIGASAAPAIDRAARLGDGWFALPQEALPQMEKQVAAYRAACAAAGTQPYVCLMRNAWIADDVDTVKEEWMGRMVDFHKTFSDARAAGDSGDTVLAQLLDGAEVSFEDYVQGRAIAGTPDMCAREIQRWHEAIQFDEISLIFGGSSEPVRLEQAITQFATEVMPVFA